MRKLGLLLRVRFDELFGISKTKSEKNAGKKRLQLIRHIVMLLLAVAVMAASFGVSKQLAAMGLSEILPVTAYVIGSVISLVVTILKINEAISGNADAEFLMSMPFSTVSQVIIMFLMLYIWNTFYGMLVEVPMGIVYGMTTSVDGSFWGLWIVGIIFTSLPASGIAALIGMFLAVVLSVMKNSNMVKSIISLSFLSAIFVLMLHLIYSVAIIIKQGLGMESSVLSQQIITKIVGNYKLARFYQNGIVGESPLWVFLFILMSTIWYVFFVFFLSVAYQELVLALQSPMSYQVYEWKALKQQKMKTTLYKREVDQWLRSKTYMLSSLMGAVFVIVLSLMLALRGAENVCDVFQIADDIQKLKLCIPFLLCFFAATCCTTYCAMSIEGRRHWIMETMPMDDKIIYGCKVRLNLSIALPMVAISSCLMCIAFHTNIAESISFVVIPVVYTIFSAYWGMHIDKKYADYSSESENQAMYQGTSFFLGYLPGLLIPIAIIVVIFAIK